MKAATFDVSGFDPLLGRTYAEVGTEERGMHKSQAMAQLLALPSGRTQQRYLLMDTFAVSTRQGMKLAVRRSRHDDSWSGHVRRRGTPPAALVSGLRAIADHVAAAQKQFDLDGPFAAASPIVAGLNAVRVRSDSN